MKRESMIKVLRYKAKHIKTKIKPGFFDEVADLLEKEIEISDDTISTKDSIKIKEE
jgi:hypothetical protein